MIHQMKPEVLEFELEFEDVSFKSLFAYLWSSKITYLMHYNLSECVNIVNIRISYLLHINTSLAFLKTHVTFTWDEKKEHMWVFLFNEVLKRIV